jgi:hypothetical protein
MRVHKTAGDTVRGELIDATIGALVFACPNVRRLGGFCAVITEPHFLAV